MPAERVLLSGFADVDGSDDPASFIDLLNKAHQRRDRATLSEYCLHILNPKRGDYVLDAACGIGHETEKLARKVGKTGMPIGIDCSGTMINEAARRARGLKRPPCFCLSDLNHLNFLDNTFDGCLAISTLSHVAHPQKVVKELIRVLKPGGRLVMAEADWDTLEIYAGGSAAGTLVTKLIRQSFVHSGMGHKLPILLFEAGFTDIGVSTGTTTIYDYKSANELWRVHPILECAISKRLITRRQMCQLLLTMETASVEGRFFATATGLSVTGTKPRLAG
jgi:ubiquinone/menaquinone biosynthesis C-methylase UbiE